ncbi:hypothetical protein SAMN05444266_107321 [Chitinophaga jiangningensis]|uniref:Uncharacterized protein n=1 Tax=Chitinophaga jiangningensis TaxID=1419482 RepID=A0A1M7HP80_9BACT|nr:hypothetical protein SAMN05444266_107321 [Chitinophaga jiangningensis]
MLLHLSPYTDVTECHMLFYCLRASVMLNQISHIYYHHQLTPLFSTGFLYFYTLQIYSKNFNKQHIS